MARGVRLIPAGARAWIAVAALLGGASIAAWFAPAAALDWQREQSLAQPWRLFSAALVHWSPTHLLANALGCAAVAAFGLAARVPVRASVAWLAAWPLTHAALFAAPGLARYGGASGMLHAGVAVTALHLLVRESGRRRAIGAAVLAGLATKIAFERPWGPALVHTPEWDFALAPFAHAAGALAGALCAAIGEALHARRERAAR